MTYPIATTAASIVVALCVIATTANASNEPSCKGILKRLNSGMPSNDHLVTGEAICDGPWKLGISNGLQFGLWKDGFGLYELFATGAEKVEVSESDDGTKSFLTVYGMTDDDIVWEVGCVDQSPNTTAKLIIMDATHVVRFAEEERLWSYEQDGSDNLDSRCIVIDNSNTDSPDGAPTTSPVAMPTKEPTDESREDDGFYDCDAMNPCGIQENIDGNDFYFPASDPAKYVQCGMSSEMCFIRDCGPGTHWDREQLVCGWAGMNVYFSLLCSAGITSMCEYSK